jgi:hypothetical protein
MGLEQIPGDLPLKFNAGNDLFLDFNIPADFTGYTWTASIHPANKSNISLPVTSTVQTSVLTVVNVKFYNSVTSLLDSTAINGDLHSWVLKYTDTSSKVRDFISGLVEVI